MKSNDILDIILKNNINGFEFPGGTDKASDHSYDTVYSKLLLKYREKAGTILEIGVQYGGSALLWHEYLPLYKLALIDIVHQVHPTIWEKMLVERYNFIETDAYIEETIASLKQIYPDGFDIIIEDGPHDINTQTFTLREYSKLLNKGGTLIIEDIQNFEHIETIMSSVNCNDYTSLEFIDLREVKGRCDDLIIVLTK
jgi:cephalosporin hydroxylase